MCAAVLFWYLGGTLGDRGGKNLFSRASWTPEANIMFFFRRARFLVTCYFSSGVEIGMHGAPETKFSNGKISQKQAFHRN